MISVGGGEDRKNPASNNARTSWTVPMDRYLIDLLLEQALEGNKIGHGFLTEAWMEMVTKFNARFGSHYDTDVLKDRYKHVRRQFNDIKNLLEQSGFSYDDTREMVSAEAYVWDSYTKVTLLLFGCACTFMFKFQTLCSIYAGAS